MAVQAHLMCYYFEIDGLAVLASWAGPARFSRPAGVGGRLSELFLHVFCLHLLSAWLSV